MKNKTRIIEKVRIAFQAFLLLAGFVMIVDARAGSKRQAATYGVVGQTTNHYIVTQNPVSIYDCNTSVSTICTVKSEAAPEQDGSQWRLEKSAVTDPMEGRFEQ